LIEATQKDGENADRLLRRFNRSVQQSGLLSIVKKKRFFERPVSKKIQRQSAIRKEVIREVKRQKKEGY
jgi:ribosomal protein S21